MTDTDLVRKTIAGDISASALLAQRWSTRITAICPAKTRRADVADDSRPRNMASWVSSRDKEHGEYFCYHLAISEFSSHALTRVKGERTFCISHSRDKVLNYRHENFFDSADCQTGSS